MTEIIDLFGRNKELETLSTTLVTITDMEDTDTDVVPEIVEIIKQLLDIIKTQQQSIEKALLSRLCQRGHFSKGTVRD